MKICTVLMMMFVVCGVFQSTAHAGAYGFSCRDSSGDIVIEKSRATLFLPSAKPGYGETKTVEFLSKTLNFGTYSKDDLTDANAVQIEVKGKQVSLHVRKDKTSCGDGIREEYFAANLEIRDLKSDKKIGGGYVICREYSEGGHCTQD